LYDSRDAPKEKKRTDLTKKKKEGKGKKSNHLSGVPLSLEEGKGNSA